MSFIEDRVDQKVNSVDHINVNFNQDYAVLDTEANNIAEQCREQQTFCEQQRGNNAEAEREIMGMAQRLSQLRLAYQELTEQNVSLDSEVKIIRFFIIHTKQYIFPHRGTGVHRHYNSHL
jgi:hypothetical protein